MTDNEAELEWLKGMTNGESIWAGAEVVGFPTQTEIFHAMYDTGEDTTVTYDEANRHLIKTGKRKPTIINGVNLDERTKATGIPLGLVVQPPNTTRLTWRAYCERLGIEWRSGANARTTPNGKQIRNVISKAPISIQPPPEGSLDLESLTALSALLLDFAGEMAFATVISRN